MRTVSRVDPSQWIITEQPELRIVTEELWNAVLTIQTTPNPRREAVQAGIAKRVSGRARPYWLGSLIACPDCGANYCGHGALDYACPSFTAGKCGNNVRFRRDDIHRAMFGLLKSHLLSDAATDRGKTSVEAILDELARAEDEASRDGYQNPELRQLNEKEAELRNVSLPPPVMNAALTALEHARAEIMARCNGSRTGHENRARRLLNRLPEIVAEYRRLVQNGIKSLVKPDAVEEAREATRALLVDGRILLAPNEDRSSVTGAVHFKDLGQHVLELAGYPRQDHKINGSGGTLPSQKSLIHIR